MNINNIDDLIRLAGLVKTQQAAVPAETPAESPMVTQGPDDIHAILGRLAKLDSVHADDAEVACGADAMGEWANTPAETGEPESRVMDQPTGAPVDTSLRRYLGVGGHPVTIDDGSVKDHTFESLSAEYRIFKESKKAKPDFLDMDKDGDKTEPMKKAVADKKKKSEKIGEAAVMEDHFKVGDHVKCVASGMTGKVVKLDKPEVGKYYHVKREDGKTMKYAPADLKKTKAMAEAESKVYRHKGTYGTSYDPSDEEKEALAKKDTGVKKGRGRPKKGADSATGEVKNWDFSPFGATGKDIKLPKWSGKVTKHKISDK